MVTELETASSFDTARAEPDVPDAPADSRWPVVALGAIIVGTFLVYALLTTGIDGPRVHPDEELYTMAASSLVAGDGLTLRGEHFGFGPLLPLMLAAIIRLAGSVDAAYDWFKFANALCFALTAVPVYLLARRLVSAWWGVAAAGLSVAIPSAISVGTVMTESLSYLITAWALYAIAIALERPTVLRQFAVLAAVAAAFFTRPQYGVLYATWIGALAILWLVAPWSRPRTRTELIRFWPTALPLVFGVLVFGARLASGAPASGSFGAYAVLWRGYDVLGVGKWFVYHLGDFAVYLAVVPVAVAPIVLWALDGPGAQDRGRRPRSWRCSPPRTSPGSSSSPRSRAARGASTGSTTVTGSTSSRSGSSGSSSGSTRPAAATPRDRDRGRRSARAPADPAVRPARERGGHRHRPGRALGADRGGAGWARAGVGPPRPRASSSSGSSPRHSSYREGSPASRCPLAVAASFAATSYFAWERMIGAPEDQVFAGGLERGWIDERLPADASVTKLYADTSCGSALERHALFLTEFFNSTVDRAAYVGDSVPDGLPIEQVDVAPSGVLEHSPGNRSSPTTSSRSPASSSTADARRGDGRRSRALAGRRARSASSARLGRAAAAEACA